MLKGKTGFNVKYVLVVTTLSTQYSQVQLIEKYYKVDVLCEIQICNLLAKCIVKAGLMNIVPDSECDRILMGK